MHATTKGSEIASASASAGSSRAVLAPEEEESVPSDASDQASPMWLPPPLPPGGATSTEISEIVSWLLTWADAVESVARARPGLEQQVGEALQARAAKAKDEFTFVSDLAREWDPNRDGAISKMEFRAAVRKLLDGRQLDVKEIDSLFNDIDLDRGGEVDISELKAGIRRLHKAAVEAARKSDEAKAKGGKLREHVGRAQAVLAATKASEVANGELLGFEKGSLGAQLGTVVQRKGLSVSDIVSKWGGKDGLIDPDEFRTEVWALLGPVAATADQIDELFRALDEDGGGTLNNMEVRRGVKKLIDESANFKGTLAGIREKANELARVAQLEQGGLRGTLAALAEQEEALKAAARREAQASAAAVETEMRAKEAAVAAKKEKAAAEKAAFEAKIQLKRQSTSASFKLKVPPSS